MMKYIAVAIAAVSAQMTMSGQSQGYSAGYAPASYQAQQTFGQQPSSQMGYNYQQGNTQVGQFKVPSSQQFSVPAGYQVDQSSQYSQYAPQYSQQYSAPSQYQSAPSQYQSYQQYPQQSSQSQYGYPQGYAQAGQYPQQQQYQSYSSYGGASMGGAPYGSSSGSTQTVQTGVRTMYVPLSQVQQVLSQTPGAKMVGTVTADRIPAGAAVY
jgi:hypothetical protein